MTTISYRFVSHRAIGLIVPVAMCMIVAGLWTVADSAAGQDQVSPVVQQPPKFADSTTNEHLGVRIRQNAPGEVTVVEVRRSGVAHRNGIRPGDQILSIDGTPVASVADVDRVLAKQPAEHDLKIVVKPAPQTHVVRMRAPQAPDGYENAKAHPVARLGVTLNLTGGRVTVAQLYSGGPADKADLRSGEVIEAIDGKPIASRKDLYDLLLRRQPGDSVTVRVASAGAAPARDVKVTLKAPVDVYDHRLVTRPISSLPVAGRAISADGWLDADEYETISDPYTRALDTDFDG
ncbi:MAG TPA: PDZ domain-containing protein [Pirellulales bacterium]|jgi:S1-C subfamily serine protease|nr:PDZ domain-containing protein [Pirellulales bacterium]